MAQPGQRSKLRSTTLGGAANTLVKEKPASKQKQEPQISKTTARQAEPGDYPKPDRVQEALRCTTQQSNTVDSSRRG